MSLDDEITEEEMDARRGASQPWCSKCECYEEDCTCLWDEEQRQREHMKRMLNHLQAAEANPLDGESSTFPGDTQDY